MNATLFPVVSDRVPAAVVDFDDLAFLHIDGFVADREKDFLICYDRYMHAV